MGTLSAAVLKVDGGFVCRERGAQQPGKGRGKKLLFIAELWLLSNPNARIYRMRLFISTEFILFYFRGTESPDAIKYTVDTIKYTTDIFLFLFLFLKHGGSLPTPSCREEPLPFLEMFAA